MHGNLCYVKSGLIGLTAALALASPAQAEVVTTRADRGVLALAADGTPYVAYTVGRDLRVALRSRGRWVEYRAGRLPGTDVILAGIRVGERPHRVVSVLAEDRQGRWISLARGSRITSIARVAPGSSFGPAGLTLDAHDRPAVAYAVQRASGETFLRLVTFDRGVRPRTRAITQKGFPTSALPPGAAPVLVRGRLHVVETYTSAAIDWGPTSGGGWEGQYLFTSALGSPQGRVGAAFISSTLWSAWTQAYPETGDISVLLTSSSDTQATSTLTHGIFVSITGGGAPEVGANDWVNLADDWPVYAALVIQGPRNAAWQLDGRLEGFVVGRKGSHHLLLSRAGELEWFRAPSLPAIEIWQGPVDADGRISGRIINGRSGEAVEIYREVPHAPRELVATVPVGTDGSFEANGLGSDLDNLYRAVYVDPKTGIPFGSLPGVPVGVTGWCPYQQLTTAVPAKPARPLMVGIASDALVPASGPRSRGARVHPRP